MALAVEPHRPLEPELAKFLPPELAHELVRQYERLKVRAWAGRDAEGVQEAGGKVAELALRAAAHMGKGTLIPLKQEIRNLTGEAQKLEQLPAAQAPDSIRLVMPRVITALYTLRNKRRGGHTASEVDPSQADALLTERIADWLVAEIFRLGNGLPPDQASATVAALVQRRIPVVYRAEGYRRVLRTGLEARAEILVLLYAEPPGATVPELAAWTDIPRTSLDRHVAALEKERAVRTVKDGRTRRVLLLPPGERLVENEGWLEPE